MIAPSEDRTLPTDYVDPEDDALVTYSIDVKPEKPEPVIIPPRRSKHSKARRQRFKHRN